MRHAVLGQHRVQNGRDDDCRDGGEFAAQAEAGVNQFTETMSILPDATAD